MTDKKKRYIAYEAGNFEFETFETKEAAKKWLKESILDFDDGIPEECEQGFVAEAVSLVKMTQTDHVDNYPCRKGNGHCTSNCEYYCDDDNSCEGGKNGYWPYDDDWLYTFNISIDDKGENSGDTNTESVSGSKHQ